MPTYDYHCTACGHDVEIFHSMADKPKRKCPACKRLKLERQIGLGGGVIFKGSGFYQTDYRSESYTKGAAKDKPASSSNDSSSSSSDSSSSGASGGSGSDTPD